jgi:phosphate transport system substrate-binding protein
MIKKFALIVTAAATCFLFVAATKQTVTVKGSDTMVILSQRWAELFMAKNKDITIQVTGGGSGVGFSALINGTTDIADASRPIKPKEREQINTKYGTDVFETKVAVDGINLYVNEANPVSELTLEQIKGIYTGEVKSWKDIGGPDEKIIVYGRENSSGTYEFLREHVLGGADYAASVQSLPGTAAIVNTVSKDKYGIGYGGAAYAKGIKVMKVKKDSSAIAYAPDEANIKKGDYPISRFLYMYTRKAPEGAAKQFIDWVLSGEGQKIITEVGYYPL